MDTASILQRVKELAPWHFDVLLPGGIRTGDWNQIPPGREDQGKVGTIDPDELRRFFLKYYPHGLAGKSVLDVACNAGGYCFLAAELGARAVTGFDVRQHWLDQAEFLRAVKYSDATSVNLQLGDASRFLETATERYDVVLFKGIFYHLPDPIHALMRACDAAAEHILIDTMSSYEVPESCLTPIMESRTHVMSGVDGLAWLPGGPGALRPILKYKGFESVDVVYWRRDPEPSTRGRFRMVGSR